MRWIARRGIRVHCGMRGIQWELVIPNTDCEKVVGVGQSWEISGTASRVGRRRALASIFGRQNLETPTLRDPPKMLESKKKYLTSYISYSLCTACTHKHSCKFWTPNFWLNFFIFYIWTGLVLSQAMWSPYVSFGSQSFEMWWMTHESSMHMISSFLPWAEERLGSNFGIRFWRLKKKPPDWKDHVVLIRLISFFSKLTPCFQSSWILAYNRALRQLTWYKEPRSLARDSDLIKVNE